MPDDTSCYNPAQWFHRNYRLYFLCECETGQGPHVAFHEGYKIKKPREFLLKYGPRIRNMLTIVKVAASVGSLVVPQLSSMALGVSSTTTVLKDRNLWRSLNTQIEQVDEILKEAEKSWNFSTRENSQYAEGAELREIHSFIETSDDHHKLGNLFRCITDEGHVRWVCIQHCQKRYADIKMQVLKNQFQDLGGEVNGGAAIVSGRVSEEFSKMLEVLRQGLPIVSVTLKDLKLSKDTFDELLKFISRQAFIDTLELENITVSDTMLPKLKKRDIISKLNDMVQNTDKLKIRYSFTKSLNKFQPKLFTVLEGTNARLVLKVRPEEHISGFELVGTNATGFTFSLRNSDNMYNISYKTAIENIFSKLSNITKILLHDSVISQSIWIYFCQFLTKTYTLQELIINCRLTLEQTKELFSILRRHMTLQTLHMFNVWERNDEVQGYKELFEILHTHTGLPEFNVTCYTDRLRLDLVVTIPPSNGTLIVSRFAKWQIFENIDMELIENFLRNISIQTLSLELTNINCDVSLGRLARVVNETQSVESLELEGTDCSAIFQRKTQAPHIETIPPHLSSIQSSKRRSRSKSRRFLALFSCHKSQHRYHSHEKNRNFVVVEPFRTLCMCNYPPLYKQMQEIADNFKLKELQVTVGTHVDIGSVASSMRWNSTVTRLKIARQVLTEIDTQMLVRALRANANVTHLSLSDTKLGFRTVARRTVARGQLLARTFAR